MIPGPEAGGDQFPIGTSATPSAVRIASPTLTLTPRLLLLAFAAFLSVSPLHAQVDTGQSRFFRFLMGTSVRVEPLGGNPGARAAAADEAFSAIAEVERIMSDYRTDSELARLNATASAQPVVVSGPLFAVIVAAERIDGASGGRFTAVVAGREDGRAVIANAADRSIRFTRPGVRLSLNGVAKGFAAELAAASLGRRGLSGTVDIGGVQYLTGLPAGKRTWSIGVVDPVRRDVLVGALDVTAGAVATASPAAVPGGAGPAPGTLSATVVSNDGTLADALSRAATALPPADALALLARFPDTWGLVIGHEADGHVTTAISPGHASAFHPAVRR